MKLIDKDALVAEIERLDALYHTSKSLDGDLFIQGLYCFLDTLEMKETDIENTAIIEWNDYIKKIDGESDYAYMLIKREDYIALAKHFLELGLKAQKGEEV